MRFQSVGDKIEHTNAKRQLSSVYNALIILSTPTSTMTLGQCWPNVAINVDTILTNNVGPMLGLHIDFTLSQHCLHMLAQCWFNVISTLAQHHIGTMLIQCCLHCVGSMLVQCHINIGPAPYWHNVDPMLLAQCWFNVISTLAQHHVGTMLIQCCLHCVGSMLVQCHINIGPAPYWHNVDPMLLAQCWFNVISTLAQHHIGTMLIQCCLNFVGSMSYQH